MRNKLQDELIDMFQKASDNNSLFNCMDIETRCNNKFTNKLQNAKKSFGKLTFKDEENLFLLDDTVFGSAKEGFLITTKGFYYKNAGSTAQKLFFKDCQKASRIADNIIVVGDATIDMSHLDTSTQIIVDILNKLISYNKIKIKIGDTFLIDEKICTLTSDGLISDDGKQVTYTYKDAIKLIKENLNEDTKLKQIPVSDKEKNMIAKAIESMAMMDEESKQQLMIAAKDHSFDEWKLKCIGKSSGVGFLSGLLGGPAGIALEVADTGYLMSMAGRACYGVGHVYNKSIDYENDIEGILAIWCGAGKTINKSQLALNLAAPIAGKIAVKVSTKVTSKIAMKLLVKASGKIIGKASTKMAGKVAGKMSTKWIPGIGGVVSAGINWWVLDGLIEAASDYYTSDYVLLDDDMENVVNIVKDGYSYGSTLLDND